METWNFGINNDKLVELVLAGKKTATTSLYNYDKLPKSGEKSILVFANEKKACITQTKEVLIKKFKDIDWNLASLEGENKSLEEWKKNHKKYFKSIISSFDDNTQVVIEIFAVVENLVLKRLEIAKKIVVSNKKLFGENVNIKEINAGFNNSIFDIDDKYIIKICDDYEKEKQFEVESNFYFSNVNNNAIPKLFKFDNSKKDVPYVYEIIEKVKGKTVYYYWYKMNENEREEFISKLMLIIKELHSKDYNSYDWPSKIKQAVINNYNKCKDLFNMEEQHIITDSLSLYEIILSDNKFSLIHNDLHFDNILIDEDKNIKLIDFNDSEIAPFDYDLRLLYMSKEQPWKWANSEMDPFQKPKDYAKIFEYVKKYYPELNKLKHLEERMIIYSILNDIMLLTRFKHNNLKERIIKNSKLILNKMNSRENSKIQ
jgi:uncharacterized protein YhfF